MEKKKNRIKRIETILLILAVILSTMVPAGSISCGKAYAATAENLTEWSVTATAKGSKNITYSLSFEKRENKYILYIPEDVVQNSSGTMTINSPSNSSESFDVTYTKFAANNSDDLVGTETTVSSVNNTATLTNFANFGGISVSDNRKELYYSKSLKIKSGENLYEVEVKPYSTLELWGIYKDNKKRPFRSESESEIYATAVKGTEYKIVGQTHSRFDTVTINDEEPDENYEVSYTPTEDGVKKFKIKVTSCDTSIESREYILTVATIEKDCYPIFEKYEYTNVTANTTGAQVKLTAEQFADVSLKVLAQNVDEATSYSWTQMVRFKETTLEESTDTLNIDTTSAKKNVVYQCTMENTVDGITYSTTTDKITVTVTALVVNAPEPAVITPNKASYVTGVEASRLTCTAKGTLGGKLTYQWYRNTENSNSGGSKIEGATKASFVPPTNEVGIYYYYCEVYDTQQGITSKNAAVSECVPVTVTALDLGMEGTGTEENPYKITKHQDFEKIRDVVKTGNALAGVYFEMTEDVTLPTDWEPIGCIKDGKDDDETHGPNLYPFSGVLNGGGKILTIQEGGLPLFNYVRDATVENLNIYGKRIAGSALVNKFIIDYGKDGNYNTGTPSLITIDHVTLLNGSSTLSSGLIAGSGSGGNTVVIRNSTIEDNVIIGYGKNETVIGSFVGRLNGSIINCSSAADVYGRNQVGGLVGRKGQSMGPCLVISSSFSGTVNASGNSAGGIIGSGYDDKTAPNTPVVTISNCYVSGTVTGNDMVGGFLGAEPVCEDCWSNGVGGVYNNCFYGEVTATGGDNIGAIIGFLRSYNKYQNVVGNYYIQNANSIKAVGKIQEIIYTDHEKYGKHGIEIGSFDETSGGTAVNVETMKSAATVAGLNTGSNSLKNWILSDQTGYPVLSKDPVAYEISLTGSYKTEYFIGDPFSTKGMVITAKYSDGTEKAVNLSDVEITGFDSSVHGVQTVTVKFGVAETTYNVRVLYKQPKNIQVTFRLYGDSVHDSDSDGKVHTLAAGNLEEWIALKTYTLNANATVKDLLEMALKDNGISWSNPTGNYVESLTRNGKLLGEFTNGKLSGWMYTLNGTHPLLGVQEQFLNNGDSVVWHYTDDYNKEEGSDKWGSSGGAIEDIKDVTTDTKAGTTAAPTEVKVSEKTNADGTKAKVATVTVSADNQKEILKQAKDNKSKEIILVVSKDSVKDAEKAEVTLDKSFVDSIVKDTDAKLTIKTPFGDKTYTQDELKALSAGATGSTITITIEKAGEPIDDNAEKVEKAKALTKEMKLTARSAKTAKKNIKITVKTNSKTTAAIKELKDLGYTVKYRYYRSTKKASAYKSSITKSTKTYVNTAGKKGRMYYYKAQVRVYDENGKLIAKTALKQCKYANRAWSR